MRALIANLPDELAALVIDFLVLRTGLYKALRLRTLSRGFDQSILESIFERNTVDFRDPIHKARVAWMSPPLFARLLLVQTQLSRRRNWITSGIWEAVNLLDHNQTDDQKFRNSLAVCEAAARHLRSRSLECLTPGVQEDIQIDNKESILSSAVVIGKVEHVKALLADGLNPNYESPCFGQPLVVASVKGNVEMIQCLLHYGADIHGLGDYYTSIRDGLPAREDIPTGSCLSSLGRSPIEEAASAGYNEIVSIMLNNRAPLTITPLECTRAVLAAAAGGHAHLVEILTQKSGFRFDEDTTLRREVFGKACENGRLDVIRMLLANGVDINAKYECRGTRLSAVQLAAFHNHTNTVQFLLGNGADPKSESLYHGSAINIAVMNGHEETVQLLLNHGIDINRVSKSRHLLRTAAEHGQVHMIGFLLKNGADPNTPVINGFTAGQLALEQAVLKGLSPVVRALVEAGVVLGEQYFNPKLDAMVAMVRGVDNSLEGLIELGERHGSDIAGIYSTQLENCSYPMEGVGTVSGLPITKETCEWIGKY